MTKNANSHFAYAYVRDVLTEQIRSAELAAGAQLPTERELCERFAITRPTLRQALAQLENEGLIFRQNRIGWFVCLRKLRYNPMRHISFLQYAAEQGFQPQTKVVSQEKLKPPQHIAEALQMDPRAHAVHLTRVRSVDERPVLVERLWFNPKTMPDMEQKDLSSSITGILKNDFHLKSLVFDVTVDTTCLLNPHAACLETNEGALGLKLVRVISDNKGQVFEYDEEYWRHDALQIENQATLAFT
ncbi:UTRA domain-containing protein [Porticoccus sp. W117]|uniref:UTRA domain-containing protein n=1 Tax=Porticoccus sp. W117 TaxID=3054777 RepID=UPI0025955BC9|nr:UTRA domain-containing protein [Porticoccus sp. W117]MDM3870472.1 UTRA domain-containing protein [Porticoccus sp. W117]